MEIVQISSRKFLAGCAAVAGGLLILGRFMQFPPTFIAAEVLLTIIALFVFGSTRYQLDKNALTYGAVMIIAATFAPGWQRQSTFLELFQRYFLSLHGLDELFHADTMLFILGLTFFVAVIAQTRLLETVSAKILTRNKGRLLPTVAALIAVVSFASGILDGVSMIGLMIRTLIIILALAKCEEEGMIFAVIISTVVTTVCGMWLAYGEPPNLIMKANLEPHLTNAFFLRYCLPVAVGSYFIVFWNLRKRLRGKTVSVSDLKTAENLADIRFYHVAHFGDELERTDPIREDTLTKIRKERVRSQVIGGLSFLPFVAFLIWHAVDHRVPLFLASFAGFAVAFGSVTRFSKMKKLALNEAVHEYKEYLFLFPLFLSITLLQKSGFFAQMSVWLHVGIERLGAVVMALLQFTGACFLSALLDNNVVADFASRALHNLDLHLLHLFAMAQIAGYAAGGCWTHIGSAQSVVAYSFIRKEINGSYTPFQWIKAMTPIIVEIFILMVVIIYAEAKLASFLFQH